jgi:hypothetical protein
MSAHAAFRRQPVPGQYAQQYKAITMPAPTRGIIQHENDAYMGPGACIVSDNWVPTMRGVKLRGGCVRHCDLHGIVGWSNLTPYLVGTIIRDTTDGSIWTCNTFHTSGPPPSTFAQYRAASPTTWSTTTGDPTLPVPSPDRQPIISAFEYADVSQQRMFAGQATKLYDVTGQTPILVKANQSSGNYCASPLSNLSGNWLIVVNDFGDPVLRFNGTSWTVLLPPATPGDGATAITGPVGSPVEFGRNLTYVAKYRSRLYFIEKQSMNLWYLPTDSVGGTLVKIPLSGAATLGGYLLFLASWTVDAGDGIDDKLVAMTSEGEALIFTGNNPADPATWRQEGRYFVGKPLGMNAHSQVGGDLLILTIEGIVPISQVITKSSGEMELAMISRAIKPMWREEVKAKRTRPWTIKRWDEYGGIFVTFPGGSPGNRYCLLMNSVTGAFARAVGYDAMCFIRKAENMYFGTQDGIVMLADQSGSDDGKPYVATLVGGWETFQARSQNVTWHQARAVFTAGLTEPFEPQITSTTDYVVSIPPPPAPGPDPGYPDVWDQGRWGPLTPAPIPPPQADRTRWAQWDQPAPVRPQNRNTLWVSVGTSGFAHAPILQVTIAQTVKPDVELVAIAATFEVGGVNV